jgi:serine/threonine protein kinase
MDDLTGKQFGPYQIVAPVGEGGMAAVYKAYQPSMERYVALKVLPRTYAEDPQFVSRFKREAKLLAQLQHPHILPVFDFGMAEGYTFIVMPFIQGGKLTDAMKGEPLPLARIRQVITQVGDALDYAHERGMIHRDVKPSNILIDERGNCLLTDFGLARMVEDSVNLTSSGAIMGTPAYMSPEQGSGQKIDARSDIYSLGIVLFEMATGRVPYQAETPVAIVFKHIQDPLPLPRKVNPAIPEAVERVILKSLSKRPEDRYPTAGDMVQAIQLAIPADSDSKKSTVFKKSAKAETPPKVTPEDELSPTLVTKPKAGVPKWVWGLIGIVILALIIGGGYWAFRADVIPFDLSIPIASVKATGTPVRTSSTPVTKASSQTPTSTRVPPDVLHVDGILQAGQELLSANKRYGFTYQPSGVLKVFENKSGKTLWSTYGSIGDRVIMQDDGNLVVVTKADSIVWDSKTNSTQGDYFLVMQDDGNLVIYRGKRGGSAVPIWATNTVLNKVVPVSGPDAVPVDPSSILFQQNFEKASANNSYTKFGNWSIVSDENGNHILCNNSSPNWVNLVFGNESWENYAVEAKVKTAEQNPDNSIEIYSRLNSAFTGYRGSLSYMRAFLFFTSPFKNLTFSSIKTESSKWYTLRLEAFGDQIKFYIDNQLMGIAYDGQRSMGKSGVGVSPNVKACVDDIRVWKLTDPSLVK